MNTPKGSILNAITRLTLATTAVLGTFSGVSDLQAKTKKKVDFAVCEDRNPPVSLLAEACKAPITNPTLRMELLESLRSEPAFQNAAQALKRKIDLSDRDFSALYPAGGAHIAPIVMAMKYIDENLIDTATFTYTEIDAGKLAQLEYLLQNIRTVAPSLQYKPDDKKTSACIGSENGTETILTLLYKGKQIQFRFLLSCSGEDYFQSTELVKNKVFISHDSGGQDVDGNICILEEYIREGRQMKELNPGAKLPPIIMEDLSQSKKYGRYLRYLDLEFLGKVTPVSGAFGHRKMVDQPMKDLSPAQIEQLKEDLKRYGDRADFSAEDIAEWEKIGSLPGRPGKRQIEQNAEVGDAAYRGAVILEMNQAVLAMDKEQRTLVFETQIIASGNKMYWNGGVGGDRSRLPPNSKEDLFSHHALMRMATQGSELLKTVKSVNPDYQKIFAYRLAQATMQLHEMIRWAVDEDMAMREKMVPHIKALYPYLTPAQQAGLRTFLARIDAVYRHYPVYEEYVKKDNKWREEILHLSEEESLTIVGENQKIFDTFQELTLSPFVKPIEKNIEQLERAAEKKLKALR